MVGRSIEEFAADIRRVRGDTATTQPKAAPMQQSAQQLYADYKKRRGMDFGSMAVANPVKTEQEQEDQPWYKDLGEGVLGVANTVLRTVDAPRALLVSATRELADAFDPNEDSSWKDFRDQYARRAGAGELLLQGPHFGIGEKGPLDEILGFGLDVVLDPLTYLTFGAAPAAKSVVKGAVMPLAADVAQEAADKSLRAAIKSGESKIIQKKLQDVAVSSGYKATLLDDGTFTFGNEALDRLIVDAGLRGRGAITPQRLLKSGVSDELALQLRLPAMSRALGVGQRKVALPGTGQLANFAENVKGNIKFNFRTKPMAGKFKDYFVTNVAGQKELAKKIADLTAPLGKRVGASVALRTVNDALGITRTWVQDTGRAAGQMFKQFRFNKLSGDDALRLVNDLETNVLSTEGHTAVRGLFDNIVKRLQDSGVEVFYREGYVPHILTKDALRLADKDPEVLKIVTDFLSKEGFQRFRTLDANSPFMDTVLQEGTIREINELFAAKYPGKKFFEDDLNVIVPRYIQNAGKALLRGEQARLLGEAGLAGPLAQQVVRETLDTSDPVVKLSNKLISKAKNAIEKQEANIVMQRNLATDARRQAILQSKAAARTERAALVAQQKTLGKELEGLQRASADLSKRLAVAERQVADAEAQVEVFKKAVAEARKDKRSPLVARLKAAEDKAKSLRRNRDRLQATFTSPDIPLQYRKKYAASTGKLLKDTRREYARVTKRVDDLTKQIVELDETDLGALRGVAERSLRAAENQLGKVTLNRDGLLDAADAAANAYEFAIAPNKFAVEQLDRAVTQIDTSLKNFDRLPTVKPRVDVSENTARIYRDNINNAATLLREANLPDEWAALVKLESAAVEADLAVAAAGNHIQVLERMIQAAKDMQFREVIKPGVTDGMAKVSVSLQSPDWLAKMFEIEDAFKQLPAFADWAGRVLGVWKGYAILRPGFHVRNAYSGMYGMFLEAGAGSFAGVKDWAKYLAVVRKFPDETARAAEAVKRFGAVKAKDLEDAWRAVNATGTGQIAGEMGKETFAGGTLNPLSNQFKLFNLSRAGGERVEDLIRGSHAYDVIRRGGDIDMAVDIVNKWQFNYSDITQFDRIMKLVNPFWIFFSRNIGLQSQSWVKSASRLNRSIGNFERNMGYGLPQEGQEPPEWYRREGAIRIGGGENGEDSPYWFTDLPAVVWPGDASELLVSNERDIGVLMSMLSPFAKVPIEFATGTSLFTGAPIKKDEFVPLPAGLRQVVNLTDFAPSEMLEKSADGEVMIRKDALNALVGLSPLSGQLERLFPGTDIGEENKWRARLAAGAGIGVRKNDERAQRGEQYRLFLEEQERAKQRASLGF